MMFRTMGACCRDTGDNEERGCVRLMMRLTIDHDIRERTERKRERIQTLMCADKMAIWHEDGLKNQDQSVETASRLLVTPSRFESDDVRIFVTASGHSRHKETLEESR
ncbi:hypothetical protein Tco_0909195 [Tanacetum coccineum]|uniref:Uncharacterized protein n=1 Tax=Tanacetum coccineum TaxID=301880 RepID=A0ABQ5CPA6_9ASTR